MSKVNLVNAYFDGDLSKSQIHDFQNQLKVDAELKNEFDFQNDIVQGLQNARKAELKNMLNNVSVGGVSVASSGLNFSKIAASVLLLGAVGTGIVWYLSGDEDLKDSTGNSSIVVEETTPPAEELIPAYEEEVNEENNQNSEAQEVIAQEIEDNTESVIAESTTERQTPVVEEVEEEKAPVVNKPDIKTPDLITSFENEDNTEDDMELPGNDLGSDDKSDAPTIDVDVDNTKRKYTFHYQLKDGRLILYGSFDKGLYEILEFNTASGKNVFLFYKDEYFALSENKEKVTPLVPVKDQKLIQKLVKARSDS